MVKKIIANFIFIVLCIVLMDCKSTPKQEVTLEPKEEQEEQEEPVKKSEFDIDKINNVLSRLTADNFVKNEIEYSRSAYEAWKRRLVSADILGVLRNDIPKEYHLKLTGHTDTTGTDTINKRLSRGRAQYIKGKLVRLKIPRKKISTSWKGSQELIDTSNPESPGNRRVELEIARNSAN